MANNETFALKAYEFRNSKIPYSVLDCQAFVERVLSDIGIKRNWRGSNHMWREALSWKGTIQECIDKFGFIPAGAWLFTVKFDGGEKERGYRDLEGNAKHVGIYTGLGLGAMHSTTGGVQECEFPSTRWTHVGLAKDICYSVLDTEKPTSVFKTEILARIDELRRKISEWEF